MALSVANMNDVVIERIIKYEHYNTDTDELMWMANQLEDATLNVTSDAQETTDAMGNVIATFYKGRKGEFKATSALFNLGIAAAQSGNPNGVTRGAAGKPIMNVPRSETFEVNGNPIVLKEVPVGASGAEVPYIYVVDGTDYMTASYAVGATADETHFSIDAATKTIKLPASVTSGRVMVNYRAAVEDALTLSATANDTPIPGRGLLYVKCHNVCNKSAIVYGVLEFLNAQISPDAEMNFTPDGKHSVAMQMMPEYCDPEKLLYRFYLAA